MHVYPLYGNGDLQIYIKACTELSRIDFNAVSGDSGPYALPGPGTSERSSIINTVILNSPRLYYVIKG